MMQVRQNCALASFFFLLWESIAMAHALAAHRTDTQVGQADLQVILQSLWEVALYYEEDYYILKKQE